MDTIFPYLKNSDFYSHSVLHWKSDFIYRFNISIGTLLRQCGFSLSLTYPGAQSSITLFNNKLCIGKVSREGLGHELN